MFQKSSELLFKARRYCLALSLKKQMIGCCKRPDPDFYPKPCIIILLNIIHIILVDYLTYFCTLFIFIGSIFYYSPHLDGYRSRSKIFIGTIVVAYIYGFTTCAKRLYLVENNVAPITNHNALMELTLVSREHGCVFLSKKL